MRKAQKWIVIGLTSAALLMLPTMVGAWQVSIGIGHLGPMSTSLNSGQEDAAVEYQTFSNGDYRIAYGEGSYLNWNPSGIQNMQADVLCRDYPQYCGGSGYNYWLTAVVFHAFAKNTNNATGLHQYGWAYCDFPNCYYDYHSDNEVRMYVETPSALSPSAQYIAQTAFYDIYGTQAKTNGELDMSTYRVYAAVSPSNRDDNAKLCIDNDSASLPRDIGGGVYGCA